jgi:hypothetical protein
MPRIFIGVVPFSLQQINGCAHALSVYPMAEGICCLHDSDFFLCQPVQIIHPFVNRGIHFFNAPLERVTAVLFFARRPSAP